MKKTRFILLLFSFSFCYSQFAIISDHDGYVNVRSSAKTANNIVDKLNNGFIIYNFGPEGNWISIDYKKNGRELNGYIYKEKIIPITEFKKISLKSNEEGKVILDDGFIKVKITETKFLEKKHKLHFLKDHPNVLNKIDNLDFLGTDGEIPKREYKSIEVEIDKVKVEIPESALKNLYEPSLWKSKANYDKANDILYIQSSNSDGAGAYEVIWVIEKKKYKTRTEAYGF
jgi:hypothetical protein